MKPPPQQASPGDDASTPSAESGEASKMKGEAPRANSAATGGPHREQIRLRFKTWCKMTSRRLTGRVDHHSVRAPSACLPNPNPNPNPNPSECLPILTYHSFIVTNLCGPIRIIANHLHIITHTMVGSSCDILLLLSYQSKYIIVRYGACSKDVSQSIDSA